MKTYANDRSGIYRYSMDITNYYFNQVQKRRYSSPLRDDGWISHFLFDLNEGKHKPFNDPRFIRSMLSIPAYVIARTLLYDSEGYTHAVERINSKIDHVEV